MTNPLALHVLPNGYSRKKSGFKEIKYMINFSITT
jgi:hypothetical protein